MFQYSLCRVVLMVLDLITQPTYIVDVSVLALSSRFDGHLKNALPLAIAPRFQYSLCRVVLMVAYA